MIAAVHVFNSAGLTFRAELFIVTAVIAWTYLLHAWFKRDGVDYRYAGETTKEGAEKYWELGHCLKQGNCPAKGAVAKNLEFLLTIRHEIEHRSTNRIDDALGAKLQACAINFNDVMKQEFGAQYGLEKRLPIALQFVNFGADQRSVLKKASGLPTHIATCIDAFEATLTQEQMDDPAYRMKIAFVPIAAKRPGAADSAIEFVKAGSADAEQVGRIVFKEVNQKRYPPSEIVAKVRAAGFRNSGCRTIPNSGRASTPKMAVTKALVAQETTRAAGSGTISGWKGSPPSVMARAIDSVDQFSCGSSPRVRCPLYGRLGIFASVDLQRGASTAQPLQ